MQETLIGYLLGALEVEEITYLEQVLENDIEARRQLEVFRMGLVPLQGDCEHIEVPTGLAIRTCQRIRLVRHPRGRPP